MAKEQYAKVYKGNGESIDHLFLHCPVTIGLWHKLFNLAGLVWVPPRSIEDMLVIAFKGLGNSLRDKTLWQMACLTLLWMVWQERNNRIFEYKGRTEEMSWDLIMFFSSLWASCIAAFRGVPLSALQFNWTAVCASIVWECWVFSVFLVFFSWVFSLLFSFCFVGRTSHPSLGFFSFSCISSFSYVFSSIILFFVSDQKKEKTTGIKQQCQERENTKNSLPQHKPNQYTPLAKGIEPFLCTM